MARKKTRIRSGGGRRAHRDEFRFTIAGFTPKTMPLKRLAEYLAELARVLGHEPHVHLVDIDEGSLAAVHRIDQPAQQGVKRRAAKVLAGEGPDPAVRAFRKINDYLREDNASATFRKGIRGAKIIEFPGSKRLAQGVRISQMGTVTGEVKRVGGTGDQVPVLLEIEGETIAGYHARRDLAKELAAKLFEQVRVRGEGYWVRGRSGRWELDHFRIEGFDPLDDAPLSRALKELRSVAGEFEPGTYEDLLRSQSAG